MQTTTEVAIHAKVRDNSILSFDEKRELIVRVIEKNAGDDIWLTYSEIAEVTGMQRKEVIRTMYGCSPL